MFKLETRYTLTTFYKTEQKSDDEVCFSRAYENVQFNKYLPVIEEICINRATKELKGDFKLREYPNKPYEINYIRPLGENLSRFERECFQDGKDHAAKL